MPIGSTTAWLLLGGSLIWATGAAAQGAEPTELNEIVVTAQKREQSLTDVGMAISAVNGETLARRNITDAQDLVRVVPGLTFANSGLNTPVYSIRGVGFNDSTLAASPTVSVYVDQVALPYPAMTQGATLDLERLEVLKGPQGTLFGQNATAGAINYIARRPTDSFEAGITAGLSRFETIDVQGYVGGPLAEGVKARLAASRTVGDDWQRSISRPGDTLGAADRGAARLTIDWAPSSVLTLSLGANGWFDKSDGQAGQLTRIQFGNANPLFQLPVVALAPVSPRDNRSADWNPAAPPRRDDKFHQLSLRGDLALSDQVALTSITAYNHYRTHTAADPDGIAAANAEFILDGRIRAFNQELRLSGDMGRLHWLVGGAYSRDRIRDDQDQQFPTSAGAQSVAGVRVGHQKVATRQSVRSWGLFASGEYAIRDQLTLVAGVRYTKEKRTFSGCALDPGDGQFALAFSRLQAALSGGLRPTTPFLPGGCITLGAPPTFSATRVVDSLGEDNVAWNIGANYNPNPDSLVYVRVARGYKSGNFPTISYTSLDQVAPVTQESLLAYEAGFRTALLDRRLRLDGSMFYYDYSDKQLKGKKLILPFGPLNALQNVPKSWVKGAELAMTAQPAQGLTLNAAATYIDTKVTRFVGYDPDGVLRDLAGIPFNFSPHWQVQAGVGYDFKISAELRGWVGADLIHRGTATSALGGDSRFDLDAYTLLDLQAGLRDADDRWRLSVWGKNVTDEFYALNVVRYVDTIARVAGRPATYGVTLGFTFR